MQLSFKSDRKRKDLQTNTFVLSVIWLCGVPLPALFISSGDLSQVPFMSSRKIPFSISCREGLLAMTSLHFCLSGTVFISPSLLKKFH